MKQKETKILIALIAIILILGTIMIATKGIAFELKYQDSQKVELNIGKEFEEKDIKSITSEVFGKQPVMIQSIEVYKDAVSITTTEITEEQKANLISKVNEKYGTELTAVFGGVKCDLTKAIIENDVVINATSVFGGIEIYVPDDVNVKIKSSSIFGGVSEKRKSDVKNENSHTIYVNATCIFGGVDIK